jgi:hypothetical protein
MLKAKELFATLTMYQNKGPIQRTAEIHSKRQKFLSRDKRL